MKIKDFLITEDATMLEAMEQLDKVAKKILFVSENDKLLASLTDGDIRRWILTKGDLNAKVKEIANYDPRYLGEGTRKSEAKDYMRKMSIDSLPLLDKEGKIVSIRFLNKKDIRIKKDLDIPVVIMAGGLGTRLYPYTKILPKPLIPIGEIPIVEHIINRFNNYGCKDFYLIVNHKKNMIKAYFNEIEKPYEITYVDEDKPLGTGGGLSLIKDKIDETFILSNCDILIEGDYESIYNYHKENNNTITMVTSIKNIKIPYGVIDINENGEIENMKEKPEFSFITNTGMYIVEPEVIKNLKYNEPVSFTDVVEKYKKEGHKVGVYPISEKSWLDMGELDQMENMRMRLEND